MFDYGKYYDIDENGNYTPKIEIVKKIKEASELKHKKIKFYNPKNTNKEETSNSVLSTFFTKCKIFCQLTKKAFVDFTSKVKLYFLYTFVYYNKFEDKPNNDEMKFW